MKNNQFRILLTLLLILVEIILGVFKNIIVETLPGKEFLEKYNIDIVTVLFILFALVILLMFVELFQERTEHKLNSQDYNNIFINNELQSKLRNKLINIVSTEVNSRLEQSLHNRVYIILNKEKDSTEVENPYEIDVKVGNKPKVRLNNIEITKVYDQPEVAGRLLILGQPGSGKTTMLLKLAEELVKQSENEKFSFSCHAPTRVL